MELVANEVFTYEKANYPIEGLTTKVELWAGRYVTVIPAIEGRTPTLARVVNAAANDRDEVEISVIRDRFQLGRPVLVKWIYLIPHG